VSIARELRRKSQVQTATGSPRRLGRVYAAVPWAKTTLLKIEARMASTS